MKITAQFLWDEPDGSIGTWDDRLSHIPRVGENVSLSQGDWELQGTVEWVHWFCEDKARKEVGINLKDIFISGGNK